MGRYTDNIEHAVLIFVLPCCGRSRLMCCRFSSVSSYETARRTSQHFQTMREEIRERLGVRSGHAHVEKRGNDSHEQPMQDEA